MTFTAGNPVDAELAIAQGQAPGYSIVKKYGRNPDISTATVVTAGSGGVNAGAITITHSTTTANVFVNIAIGTNQSFCSCYTVPAGYTAYMRDYICTVLGNTQASVSGVIWTRPFNGVFRQRRPFTAKDTVIFHDSIYGGLIFTEKSDMILRITECSNNNVAVAGGYDLVLVQN